MTAIRALLSALLLVTSVAGWQLASTPAASAEEPPAYASVRLTAMQPALPRRGGTVTLAGEVTNASELALSNLQVAFWRSFDPIVDAEGLQAALDSPANRPLGSRVNPNTLYQNIPAEDDRVLDPGESTRFSLTAEVDQLRLPNDGVYLIGVHIRGRLAPDGPDITLGRSRVFLPLVESPPRNTLQITSLVVLASRPSMVRRGVLADDHLADEIAAGGRLRALLEAADQAEVSFAVDPALIEELQTMRSGYSVLGSDDSARESEDAARWLAAFDDLAAKRDGYRLLYGSVDAAALVHGGQQPLLQDAKALGATLPATAKLPLLALPGRGAADEPTVTALADLKPAAVVLSETSAPGPAPLLAGPRGTRIVRYSTAVSGGGPGPEPDDTAVHLQQRMLAEAWIEASSAPAGSTLGRVRLVTSAAQASSDATGQVPWTRRGTLGDLLQSTPATWKPRYRYSAAARARELSPSQLAGVQRLAASSSTYVRLLNNPAEVQREATAAVLRSASISFRRAVRSWRTVTGAQQSQLDTTLQEKLKISVTRRVITSARSGVGFPLTVRNELPADPDDPSKNAIRGWVVFTSANRQRLTVDRLEVPLLRAGESFTSNAQVQAESNGTVRVVAQLTTVTGSPVGKPVTIDVTATQAGTTGWIIAIAAGLVLVGTTALRIRQVARERVATAASPPEAPSQRSAPAQPEPPGTAARPDTLDG